MQTPAEANFNEYMAAFVEQMRANRRANDFLAFCADLYEGREATALVWLVDAAVRTYASEMIGETFTESEIWPRLRPKVLEDLKRVDLQAWSVRSRCPIEHLVDDRFELADLLIVTEPLNRGELPRFEAYELPVANPWKFVGVVPEIGRTLPKPRWWNRPRQYWNQTLSWHNGRPVFEPAASVRPGYVISLTEVQADLRRLGLPLTAQKVNPGGLFEIVWDHTADPLPAVLKAPRRAGGAA